MSRQLFQPTKVHRKKFVVNEHSQIDPTWQRAAWKRNKELDERRVEPAKKSRLQYVTSSSRALEDGSSVSYTTGVKPDAIKGYTQRELMDRLRELDEKNENKKGQEEG